MDFLVGKILPKNGGLLSRIDEPYRKAGEGEKIPESA